MVKEYIDKTNAIEDFCTKNDLVDETPLRGYGKIYEWLQCDDTSDADKARQIAYEIFYNSSNEAMIKAFGDELEAINEVKGFINSLFEVEE